MDESCMGRKARRKVGQASGADWCTRGRVSINVGMDNGWHTREWAVVMVMVMVTLSAFEPPPAHQWLAGI